MRGKVTLLLQILCALPVILASCRDSEPRNPDGSVGKPPAKRPAAPTQEEENAIQALEERNVDFSLATPPNENAYWSVALVTPLARGTFSS